MAGVRHYRENERDADFFAVHYEDVHDALGLFADRDSAGRLHLRSEGSDPGFQASVNVYPDEDAVVANTLNSWGRRPKKPAPVTDPLRRILELCLGW